MKKRILFIDDEPHVLDGLRRSLRNKRDQWEMNFVNSGIEALKFISQVHLPDLIVCDIMMPEMDGYSVLGKLRENPKTAIVPFMFLSGKDEKQHIRQGMDLGADDFLTKPFSAVELSSAINARLIKKVAVDDHSESLEPTISSSLPRVFGTQLLD